MYGKNRSLGEEGLGIANDPQREINKQNYIQLDLSYVSDTKLSITMQNIQKEGGFAFYGSNKQGSIGDLLYTSPDFPSIQTILVPQFKKYQYISVTAAGSSLTANVLLHSIDFII